MIEIISEGLGLTPEQFAQMEGLEVKRDPGPYPQFYKKGKPVGYAQGSDQRGWKFCLDLGKEEY